MSQTLHVRLVTLHGWMAKLTGDRSDARWLLLIYRVPQDPPGREEADAALARGKVGLELFATAVYAHEGVQEEGSHADRAADT